MPAVWLFLAAGCRQTGPPPSPPISRPNIVLILADDLGYGDLGCYGQRLFDTPNIDRLAADGMRFTQHYAGAPVCAPARACLLTGLHTGHAYIRGNREVEPEGQFPLSVSALTLAEALKKGGYVTGAFGKWGLGYPGSEGDPNNQGFDEFFGYNCQRMAHNYYPYYLWHNQQHLRLLNNAGQETGSYAPEIIHQKALSFLEQNKDTSFFLYYPTTLPHAELAAPEPYMRAFRGKFPPETPYDGVDGGETYKLGAYGSQAAPHAAFAAMVSLLDKQVGELRQKLEDLGIADQTLILFTSDNGPHMEGGADPDYFDSNGPFRGYKRDLYEGGIRVPFIACWPGIVRAGSISSHVSAFWDLFPTLGEVAGLPPTPGIDGISMLPALLGEAQEDDEYLYWEFHEQGGKQAVRMGQWKGVRLGVNENPPGPVELYNLEQDPGETNDVATDNPRVVERVRMLMDTAHVPSPEFPFGQEASRGIGQN